MAENGAVLLAGTETVELMNKGEIAVITFRDDEGPITPIAIPVREVMPLVMELIGAPPVTAFTPSSTPDNAPIIGVDALGVTLSDADPGALYIGVEIVGHALFLRVDRSLAVRLTEALNGVLGQGPSVLPKGSTSSH